MLGQGIGVLKSLLFDKEEAVPFLTAGKVEDTNDPEQMGRVRVRCAKYGDKLSKSLPDLPWALPVSPLAGVMTHGLRGTEQSSIDAPVPYGMWNVPKVGSYVLVGCIDGDMSKRFYIGGLHPQFLASSLPHGRYVWRKAEAGGGHPEGPYSPDEIPIEPLYSSITQQFTAPDAGLARRATGTPTDPRKGNAEYASRGADMQASALDEDQTQDLRVGPGNTIADHRQGEAIQYPKVDGTPRTVFSPGYGIDQMEPTERYGPETGYVNYDSHNYSWTTPGFHSFSMNDRYDQCRIRVRTTSGHQIIMDDTNERIYISAAGGGAYIEIDKVGNIDVFAAKNISTHAKGDINFYSDKTIRMQAEQGVHIQSGEGEFRVHTAEDIHIRTEKSLRTYSGEETRIEATADYHTLVGGIMYVKSTGDINIKSSAKVNVDATGDINIKSAAKMSAESTDDINVKSGAKANIEAADDINIKSDEEILLKSEDMLSLRSNTRIAGDTLPNQIYFNQNVAAHAGTADSAGGATDAQQALEIQANWTTRVPEHEPWARIFMLESDSDATVTDKINLHSPEYPYTDALVGKGGRGETYPRGPWWQR